MLRAQFPPLRGPQERGHGGELVGADFDGQLRRPAPLLPPGREGLGARDGEQPFHDARVVGERPQSVQPAGIDHAVLADDPPLGRGVAADLPSLIGMLFLTGEHPSGPCASGSLAAAGLVAGTVPRVEAEGDVAAVPVTDRPRPLTLTEADPQASAPGRGKAPHSGYSTATTPAHTGCTRQFLVRLLREGQVSHGRTSIASTSTLAFTGRVRLLTVLVGSSAKVYS